MKCLWLSFSFITAEPWLGSLWEATKEGHPVHWYDRESPPDRGCLDAADFHKPDIIIYTGMAAWEKTPSPDTFKRLRKMAPVIHISGDLSDPPYIPYLERYLAEQCFDVSVNIDGNDNWLKGPNDMTLLSPTAPQFYSNPKPLLDRPIPFGFAGGYSSPSRAEIILKLVRECGLIIPQRNEQYGSYKHYARFLLATRLVPNVPFSGSDNSRQVKGRVLEAGMAGCCLLEHESSAAKDWFTPGVDYAVYNDSSDAVCKAKWLLDNPETMQKMADNLHKRVMEEHSPQIFWNKVFKAIGK